MSNLTTEKPPPYSGNNQQWAEDITDWLIRLTASIDRELNDIITRLEALEP
ncbi:MAG TPA: hypothetical protein VMW50_10630 [Dehalococcoidia bacterium]|nr:hypothetical protein [Dehalococcoidia bacterium]